MVERKKAKITRAIVAKARKVLEFAEKRAGEVADQFQLSNSLFAPDGLASVVFPTEAERTAFCRTKEYKQIQDLIARLPLPPVTETIVIRIPAANGKKKSRSTRRSTVPRS